MKKLTAILLALVMLLSLCACGSGSDKQTLIVRGLPEAAEVWVYDPSGKLLHHEQTRHYERQYEVPQQGTYLVRVESQDGGVTLRGVCR